MSRRANLERELRRLMEAAEAASRAKSSFLAYMSHELRTQVNGLVGLATLLHEISPAGEQAELARTLRRNAEMLIAILNDILDLSKIEAGYLTLECVEFDFAEQIHLATDLYAETAARKGVRFLSSIEPAIPERLRGDPLRLRQILDNLLSNAVKFTEHGEIVLTVALDRAYADRSRLRFEVCDTGTGISEEAQARLFQPYAQADVATCRHFGGTGLGLAICKDLVALMHGDIGVKSAPEAGSTFWFTVELRHAAPA